MSSLVECFSIIRDPRQANNPAPYDGKSIFQGYDKYSQLLSSSYFKASLDYLVRHVKTNYEPTKTTANKGFTKLADGAIYYDASYRWSSVTKVNEMAINTIKINEIYGFNHYKTMSKSNELLFTRFIEHLKKTMLKLNFSYHPTLQSYITILKKVTTLMWLLKPKSTF